MDLSLNQTTLSFRCQMYSIDRLLDGKRILINDKKRILNFFNSRDELGTLDGYINTIRNTDRDKGREYGKKMHRYLISYRFPKVHKALKSVAENAELPESYADAIDSTFSKVFRSDYDRIIEGGFYDSLGAKIII